MRTVLGYLFVIFALFGWILTWTVADLLQAVR